MASVSRSSEGPFGFINHEQAAEPKLPERPAQRADVLCSGAASRELSVALLLRLPAVLTEAEQAAQSFMSGHPLS